MKASLLAALAWRNLARNVRRTLLLATAVTVGVAGLVFMAAFLRGWLDSTVEVAVDALVGHVRIHAPGWLDDPGAGDHFVLDAGLRQRLDGDPAITAWASRIRVPAVVLSERESRGVMLAGVEPARESALSFVGDAAITGRRLKGPGDDGLILGAALAEALGTGVGKRVVLMLQDAGGGTVERGYRVVGVLDVASESLEKGFAFTGRESLAGELGLAREGAPAVTEVSARLDRRAAADVDAAAATLGADLPGFEVRSWRDLVPQAAAMVDLSRSSIWVVYVITMTALGFGLVNTLLASVIERVRELGLLQAIGMRPSGVVGQVVLESWMILGLGLALGLVAGLAGVAALARDGIDLGAFAGAVEMAGMGTVLYPRIETPDVVQIVAVVLVLGVLASVWPARKAVSIDPLDAVNRIAE
jgi:ABC-type lipoprotein release transport system permease subunit